jgi:hypothetical protein
MAARAESAIFGLRSKQGVSQRTVRQLEAVLVLPFLLGELEVQPLALLLVVALGGGGRPALAAGDRRRPSRAVCCRVGLASEVLTRYNFKANAAELLHQRCRVQLQCMRCLCDCTAA